MTLARERCEACNASTPTLGVEELERLRGELDPAWEVEGVRLRRRLRTPDFATALATATHIGLVAEAEGHHPDLCLGWGRLDIELTTHAAGGLTRNDVVMAAKIDAILTPPAR